MKKKLFTKPRLYIKGGLGSGSAKRVAQELSNRVGYRVFRSLKEFPKKAKLQYGQGVDKLTQYRWFALHDVPGLEFTTEMNTAMKWCYDEKQWVFGRKLLSASCGKGIISFDPSDEGAFFETDPCPVYTKYKKKKREFRVHVYKDSVVRVVEKKLRSNWNGPRDSKIRNLANGFVFCSCNAEPEGLRVLALKAAGCVASDFKGIDIGYNEKHNELFVIEVNSAPGIEGTNVQAYVNAILA